MLDKNDASWTSTRAVYRGRNIASCANLITFLRSFRIILQNKCFRMAQHWTVATLTAILQLTWWIISLNTLFAKRWLCNNTWPRLIIDLCPNIVNVWKVNRRALTTTINNLLGAFGSSNTEKVYHKGFLQNVSTPTLVKRERSNWLLLHNNQAVGIPRWLHRTRIKQVGWRGGWQRGIE